MIKTMFHILTLAAVLLAISVNGFSQTTPTSTTLSAAIADERTNRFTVASATGFTASTGTLDYGVFIDREFMRIRAVSGTTITVDRGQARTSATPHRSGSRVWVGRYGSSVASGTSAGGPFIQSPLYGSCTATREPFLPVIQVNATAIGGQGMYNCNNGQWEYQTLLNDQLTTLTRYCTIEGLSLLAQLTTFGDANSPIVVGNNQTPVAGTVYYGTLFLPRTMFVTGVSVLNGTVAGTDTLTSMLYRADGVALANSAQTTASGIDRFQDLAFSTAYLATGPARYWVGVSSSGTTTRLRNLRVSPGATTAGLGAFTGALGSTATYTYGLVGTANLTVLGTPTNTATGALPTTLINASSPVACIY